MWKKDDMPDQPATQRPDASLGFERAAPPRTSAERASIGRSITIKGEVTGDEDLLIQGRVEGSVNLKQHSVTVGPEGEVKANISGRVVTVEGKVEGNLTAEEQVILRSAAVVEGDITAPRVVLEDGARFRGGVDMGATSERGRHAAGPQTSAKSPDARSGTEPSSRPASTTSTDEARLAAAGKQEGAHPSATRVR